MSTNHPPLREHPSTRDVNFVGCNLSYTSYPGADFSYMDLSGSTLEGINFTGANLSQANFSHSNLFNARLSNANFGGTKLSFANLMHADLTKSVLVGSDIDGAKISWCAGNGKEIKNIYRLVYPITYTKDVMAIGCEQHTIEEWETFSDKKIDELDEYALEFWNLNKRYIFDQLRGDPCPVL